MVGHHRGSLSITHSDRQNHGGKIASTFRKPLVAHQHIQLKWQQFPTGNSSQDALVEASLEQRPRRRRPSTHLHRPGWLDLKNEFVEEDLVDNMILTSGGVRQHFLYCVPGDLMETVL